MPNRLLLSNDGDEMDDFSQLPRNHWGKIVIDVIWTGGTIGSQDKHGKGGGRPILSPGLSGPEFGKKYQGRIRKHIAMFGGNIQYRWHHLAEYENGFDSSDNNEDIMVELAVMSECLMSDPESSGVILAHGTDSLAHTAAAIALQLHNTTKPLVITGAQRNPESPHSDAIDNFALATRLAISDLAEPVVAFSGKALRASAVEKREALILDAFDSPHQFPLAEMQGEMELFWNEKAHYRKRSSLTKEELRAGPIVHPGFSGETDIIHMRPYMNDVARLRRRLEGLDAVVIVGYAAGNLPHKIRNLLEEMSESMHIIMTPSCATRSAKGREYEVSVSESDTHISFAERVLPAVAELKHRWLQNFTELMKLKEFEKQKWIKNRFALNVAGESPINYIKGATQLDMQLLWQSPTIKSFKAETIDDLKMVLGSETFLRMEEYVLSKVDRLQLSPKKEDDWINDRMRIPFSLGFLTGMPCDPVKDHPNMDEIEELRSLPTITNAMIDVVMESKYLLGPGYVHEQIVRIYEQVMNERVPKFWDARAEAIGLKGAKKEEWIIDRMKFKIPVTLFDIEGNLTAHSDVFLYDFLWKGDELIGEKDIKEHVIDLQKAHPNFLTNPKSSVKAEGVSVKNEKKHSARGNRNVRQKKPQNQKKNQPEQLTGEIPPSKEDDDEVATSPTPHTIIEIKVSESEIRDTPRLPEQGLSE
jgi:L-asparaginase/Glu-tRNA(Gln) amidotransferase subunit D